MKKDHLLINATSGKVEYWTPTEIIEAARATMGSIDLDPASSALANKRVGATHYFDEATDGLRQQWWVNYQSVNVWMNHPFGRVRNRLWIGKLLLEVNSERVAQACFITY